MNTTQPVCVAVVASKVPRDFKDIASRRLKQLLDVVILPAVSACGMELIHLDPAMAWPLMQRHLLDNLLLSDAAIFEVSDHIPEVLYLLGIRLALRPESTILLEHDSVSATRFPALPVALAYQCDEHGSIEARSTQRLVEDLTRGIETTKSKISGIETEYYHLLREYRAIDISRTKTDRFRTAIRYRLDFKTRLAEARALGRPESLSALRQIETELAPGDGVDSAVFVDLFLSYRAEGGWEDICRLYPLLPLPLRRAVMIREQYALALNRRRMRQPALEILEDIESTQGPSSETCSLMGRVYKDLWQDHEDDGDRIGAETFLRAAIDAYRRGFKADWRDAYPGINLLTLLEVDGEARSFEERNQLFPIVRFAAEQRVEGGSPDYWDQATLLELAVLENDQQGASRRVRDAIDHVTESWQPETTASNLKLLQRQRRRREQSVGWMDTIISSLEARAKI